MKVTTYQCDWDTCDKELNSRRELHTITHSVYNYEATHDLCKEHIRDFVQEWADNIRNNTDIERVDND